MSFELKNISKEETMTAEEKQQYFEQLCQMDEEDLRKLFENSDLYKKLKNLTERYERYAAAKQKQLTNTDLISRKAVLERIGEDTLFPYLTDEDIRKHGLFTDEDGIFSFTEEQWRISAVMYDLMRRFITNFPETESSITANQYTGITDKHGNKIFVGNKVKVWLNGFEEDTGTVTFQDGAYGVKFNRLFSRVHNHFMSFHALITCYKGQFEIIN